MARKVIKTPVKAQKATPVKVASKTKVSKAKVQKNNNFSAIQSLATKINLAEKKTYLTNLTKNRPPKVVYIAAVLIGLAIVVSVKKDWFVAATVNSTPISNLDLQLRLNKQFRSKLLSQMINEQVILNEAKKKGVIATDQDVVGKLSQVEQNVGGPEALNSLLSQQGETLDSIKDQLRIQVIVEKLYANEATVSAEEVNEFIDQNKDSLQATDSAGQIKEVTDLLQQQKLTQLFQQKFQELKTSAKIQIF